ncbi:MAG: acyl-CoA synthetase [Chloroflexi bacterium]|nr:acyl-CoA synthetase [Chloroflexota bacterium]
MSWWSTIRGRLRGSQWRGWALRAFSQQAWKRFEAAARHAPQAQADLLFRLVRANQDSRFGRDHEFRNIRSLADYRSAVPIGDYERFRPYVDRIVAGEADALTSDPPYMLAQTSGTTGVPKLIPVTLGQRAAAAAATQVWFYRALLDHPRLLDGQILAMVSPAVEGHTPGGLPYGSASGHLYQNAPWSVRQLYAIPYAVTEIKDYEARYYTAMRFALQQLVSFVGTPNPSTISRLLETVNAYPEELIRDINDGTLSARFDISNDIRATLVQRLVPDPKRAEHLRGLADAAGALRPKDFWPDLQLVGCWKGGSVGVQLQRLQQVLPAGLPFRDIGYLASEANLAIPIQGEGAGGVLAVGSNVYEFIPEDAIGHPGCPVLRCDEVVAGHTYYVVITVSNGLYRYDINDVVRVSGFFYEAPIVEFVRKGRDMTSIGGEKIHVSQVTGAIDAAQRESGCAIRQYRAVASAAHNRYEFLVELEDGTDEATLVRLLAAIDRILGELNIEYAQKRASRRLDDPCLRVMQAGWSEAAYLKRVAAGARDTQFKPTLLSDQFDEGETDQIRVTIELR